MDGRRGRCHKDRLKRVGRSGRHSGSRYTRGEYKHALDLYFGENADGEKNAGNFLLVLMYSSQRYRFFSDVLRPLLGEFMGKDAALEMYVDILRLEKEMEDLAACLAAIERERSAIQAY